MAIKFKLAMPTGKHPKLKLALFIVLAPSRSLPSSASHLQLLLLQVQSDRRRAPQAAHLRQHRQNLRRAARSPPWPEAERARIEQRTPLRRLLARRRLETLAARHLRRNGILRHRPPRPAVVPLPGRRGHPHFPGRRRHHHRRSWPAALQLRARAAAHHRPQRRRQPHQAPPAHLRRDSTQPGPGRHRHRRPPLL
jgi:hypothetical protein